MRGLEETVTFVKKPHEAYAARSNGARESIAAVKRKDALAVFGRSGALSPALHEIIEHTRTSEDIPVTVQFHAEVNWKELLPRLRSSDRATVATARAELHEKIRAGAEDLQPYLRQNGFSKIVAGHSMPVLFAHAGADALRAVARDRRIRQIRSNARVRATELTLIAPAGFVGADEIQSLGYKGDEQRVGVVDPGSCKIWDEHPMFDDAVVTNMESGTACETDSQCNDSTTSGPCQGSTNKCISGRCADWHGTATASVVSQVAPKAELYYANNDGACSESGILDAYEWFESNDVYIINESYQCYDNWIFGPSELDGITQDYFSRVYGMAVIKAAGNMYQTSYEGACPDSLNSICVGSVNASKQMSCFSNWRNPGYNGSWASAPDREEPDLTAAGGDGVPQSGSSCQPPDDRVLVADFDSPFFTGGVGTSFAAPAIAGVCALMAEGCEKLSGTLFRALLRNAATNSNPEGPRYSTLWATEDSGSGHKDGGGFLRAPAPLAYCGIGDDEEGGPTDRYADEGTIDPEMDGEPTLPGDAGVQFPDDPPKAEEQDQSKDPGDGDPGWRWKELWQISLQVNDRIRASFTWDACTTDSETSGVPATVATDFDLFLYNTTTGQYYYASQTYDDNNEGFDVDILQGHAGNYSVIVAWPDGGSGCEGIETYAFAASAWVTQ